MSAISSLGVIGVGTMGEPICAHLAGKSGLPVYACDRREEPLRRLAAQGVVPCPSPAELAERADLILLSLPSGREVEELCLGRRGVLGAAGRRVHILVDCGTSPVALTRRLGRALDAAGIAFADAPVARTRQAALDARLSVMVGAAPELFARLLPFLGTFATDITHCGPVGSGQVVKILNNMVLFETVGALAEALALGRRAGLDERLLLEALSKGSADSFALRNHGMKAMLPRDFPEDAFAAEYALKDLSYALELARDSGVAMAGAEVAETRLIEAIRRGHGRRYWPVLLKVVAGEA